LKPRDLFIILICFVFLGVCLSGCGTLKGVWNGMKDDWQTIKRWDQKFRETWW
jgi:hypothetical protein